MKKNWLKVIIPLMILSLVVFVLPKNAVANAAFVTRAEGENTSPAASVSTTAFSATTGNLLVVVTSQQNNGAGVTTSITDTAGNTWNQAGTCYASATLQNYLCEFYAYNIIGNASDVVKASFSPTPSGGYEEVVADQFSGYGSTDPYASSFQSNTGTSAAPQTSSPVVTSGASSVIVAFVEADGMGLSQGSGFTAGGTSPSGYFFDEYAVVSASTVASAVSANNTWRIIAAAFNTPAAPASSAAIVTIHAHTFIGAHTIIR